MKLLLDQWDLARRKGFIIVSKDADFHQRSFLYGHSPKVVWLRGGNRSTDSILQTLLANIDSLRLFHADPDASFLVLS